MDINLLFDFYGELLTERQRDVFTLHHMEDYSLAEIGNELNITPQGVADLLKRSKQQLIKYEQSLCLADKHILQQGLLTQMITALDDLDHLSDYDISENVSTIRDLISSLKAVN